MKNQSFANRLGFALVGIRAAARSEASFRSQLCMAGAAAAVIAVLRPPTVWIALCVIAAGMVLALELLNTALEHLADRVHPERHPDVQIAKDCAAGAVLVASITALVIGSLTVVVGLGWWKG